MTRIAPAVLLLLALAGQAPAADPPQRVQLPPVADASTGSVPPAPGGPQRMELDATSIRGNQELPKVLHIVPWKEPQLAEPAGRPLNSLIDEALAPVDREVFRRQVTYFDQLYPRADVSPGDGTTAR